jgi:pterin-4a-carbinolamine dehydratase
MSNPQWQERRRPARLEQRYEFDDYEALRTFLDEAAELSEREGLYPDMGFARDYVNITIHADEGSATLADKQRRFAQLLDELRSV